MKSSRVVAAAALVAGLLASSITPAQVVRVGSKNFTEQFVLAEIYAQALEAAGVKVDHPALEGQVVRQRPARQVRPVGGRLLVGVRREKGVLAGDEQVGERDERPA